MIKRGDNAALTMSKMIVRAVFRLKMAEVIETVPICNCLKEEK